MKSLRPKKLSFDEMWKLYKTLKKGIPEQDKTYLIQEVSHILENITDTEFKESLRLMYDDSFHINRNPAEFALLFVKGIKKTNIVAFSSFIKGITSS